jgi:transposase
MSLPQQPIPPVPAATAHFAQLAFPGGNVYMQMRDELGSIYKDALFANWYATEGQPAVHPWRLALESRMQFAENLSDRQAAAAVRARIAWKYALSLDLGDSGFHSSVLSEFRARLLEGGLEQILLRAAAGTLSAARLAQSTRAPTDRLHACGGCGQSPESA